MSIRELWAGALAALLCVCVNVAHAQDDFDDDNGNRLSDLPFPLVYYNVSGSVDGGPVQVQVSVYSSGFAIIGLGGVGLISTDRVFRNVITIQQLRRLRSDLRDAGAEDINPQLNFRMLDRPIRTVTFFSSTRTVTLAHTFSYNVIENRTARVDQVMRDFINEVFPGALPALPDLPN